MPFIFCVAIAIICVALVAIDRRLDRVESVVCPADCSEVSECSVRASYIDKPEHCASIDSCHTISGIPPTHD